jgi:hypothetical protein
MRPDTHANIEVEAPPVPALDAGARWVLAIARRRPSPVLGCFFQLNPGLQGSLQSSAPGRPPTNPQYRAGNWQPRTPIRTLAWFPNLEKSISGARRCTKVHGGVLRSPGSPPLGGRVRLSRPCKTENRSSFGQVLVKFSSAGSARPLGPSGRAPKGGDKTRQNIPRRAKPCFGDAEKVEEAWGNGEVFQSIDA